MYAIFVGGVRETECFRSLTKAREREAEFKKADPSAHVVVRERQKEGRVTRWTSVDSYVNKMIDGG